MAKRIFWHRINLECDIDDGKVWSVRFLGEPPDRPQPLVSEMFLAWLRFQGVNSVSIEEMTGWDYSEFTAKVLKVTAGIEPGEVMSYQDVAVKVGNARGARAVGQALARNRTPVLIPCHRVVSTGGALGGFSAGLAWKKYLLDCEIKGRLC